MPLGSSPTSRLHFKFKGCPPASSSPTPDPATNSSGSPQALGSSSSAPTKAPSTSKSYSPPALPPNLVLEPEGYYTPPAYRSMSFEDMKKEAWRVMIIDQFISCGWRIEDALDNRWVALPEEDLLALHRRFLDDMDNFPLHSLTPTEYRWLEDARDKLRSIGISMNIRDVLRMKEDSNRAEQNIELRDLTIADQALLDAWKPHFSPCRPLYPEEHLQNVIDQYEESSKDGPASYEDFQKLWKTMVDKFEGSSDSAAFQKSVSEVMRMGWKLRDQQSAELLNEFKELHFALGRNHGQQ